MGTIERFREYLDYKGIANFKAEKDCGLSNGLIKNALKSNSALGSDKLEKILSTYSDLSAEWLLRGTGDMIIGEGKVHELVSKIANMGVSKERQDITYDILLNMFETMRMTYEFFEKKQE
jgi:hypothetical protein